MGSPAGKFCSGCAQELHLEPLTFKEYALDFIEHYLAPGGILARTVWRLLSQPGQLTKDYREGRRNRFVRPIRLVFTLVILTFLLGKALEVVAPNDALRDLAAKMAEMNRKAREAKLERRLHPTASDISLAQKSTISGTTKEESDAQLAADIAQLSTPGKNESADYIVKKSNFDEKLRLYAMLLIAPLLAILIKGLYWNRSFRYGDYLVFSLHVACANLLWGTFLTMPTMFSPDSKSILIAVWLSVVAFLVVYIFIALKRAYDGRWDNTIVRTVVVLAGLAVLEAGVDWLMDGLLERYSIV